MAVWRYELQNTQRRLQCKIHKRLREREKNDMTANTARLCIGDSEKIQHNALQCKQNGSIDLSSAPSQTDLQNSHIHTQISALSSHLHRLCIHDMSGQLKHTHNSFGHGARARIHQMFDSSSFDAIKYSNTM